MANNSLIMLRENFTLEPREANTVKVTARHPIHGNRTLYVCVPAGHMPNWEEYAMGRWVAVVDTV